MIAQARRLVFRKKMTWYLEVNIECKAYTMTYLTYNIDYSMYNRAYLKSRVFNRAIYQVIILPCLFPWGAPSGWICGALFERAYIKHLHLGLQMAWPSSATRHKHSRHKATTQACINDTHIHPRGALQGNRQCNIIPHIGVINTLFMNVERFLINTCCFQD